MVFSSSSTFSSSDTSSTPSALATAGCLAGLFDLKTKPNSLEPNDGALTSLGLNDGAADAAVVNVFGAPNEKLNVDEPKELVALVLAFVVVDEGGFCVAAGVPKLNVGAFAIVKMLREEQNIFAFA